MSSDDLHAAGPRLLVLTGVENSGKTTLARALAAQTNTPLIEEAARQHPDVLAGRVTPATLLELLEIFHCRVHQARTAQPKAPWIICDTGPMVLKIWAQVAFGSSACTALAALETVRIDQYVLCRTLKTWRPDPLRSLPDLHDRRALEKRYVEQLTDWATNTQRLDSTRGLLDLPHHLSIEQRIGRVLAQVLSK